MEQVCSAYNYRTIQEKFGIFATPISISVLAIAIAESDRKKKSKMDLSNELTNEEMTPTDPPGGNDIAMDVVTTDDPTTALGEVDAAATVDDDSDECDDEISWIESVPAATISNGELYRNTRAVRWKGIDWMVVVVRPKDNIKTDRVGYFLGYETAQVPKNFSLTVHVRCHVVDSEGKNVPHPVQDSTPAPFHHFTYEIGDSGGYFDWGVWERLSLSAALAHVDANQRVHLRFSLAAVYTPQKNPGLGYKSKEATGMVGLENLGATCYLNALLQMLYNVNLFRKNVYLLPHEVEVFENSTTLALQSVFRNLQCGKDYVTTKDLTRAFGWTSQEAFMQQDVQEMMRVLLDKLEEKMKGTNVEGTIASLFSGSIRSFIRCVDVTYESKREEEFYDVQLDVKDCKDIYASLEKYTAKGSCCSPPVIPPPPPPLTQHTSIHPINIPLVLSSLRQTQQFNSCIFIPG